MAFKQLASDFQWLVRRYGGPGRDYIGFLAELRDTAANAGKRLLSAITQREVEPPEDTPPWLRFSMGGGKNPRFARYEHPNAFDTSVHPPYAFSQLVEAFTGTHHTLDKHGGAGVLGRDPIRFQDRHVFLEAATVWLPERYSEELDRLPLPTWTATTTKGKRIEFVSDLVAPDPGTESIPIAIQMAKACARACEVLATTVETCQRSRNPEGEPLSELAAQVYELLLAVPQHRGLTGRKIMEALDEQGVYVTQGTLTKTVIPQLKRRGVKNKPRNGYFIPLDSRPASS